MSLESKNKTWFFIDYENVPYKLSDIIQYPAEKYFLFVGRKQNLQVKEEIKKTKQIEIIQIEGNGKNNLDFHLSYYLGLKNTVASQEIQFKVFTKDKGFLHLLQFINKTGRICEPVFELPFLIDKGNFAETKKIEILLSNLKKIKP